MGKSRPKNPKPPLFWGGNIHLGFEGDYFWGGFGGFCELGEEFGGFLKELRWCLKNDEFCAFAPKIGVWKTQNPQERVEKSPQIGAFWPKTAEAAELVKTPRFAPF